MTPDAKTSDQRIRQQAQEDVQDIDALAQSSPFNRYWVRRLNELFQHHQKQARLAKDAPKREEHRVTANFLEELTGLPAADRISAEKVLRTPASGGEQRPVQVG